MRSWIISLCFLISLLYSGIAADEPKYTLYVTAKLGTEGWLVLSATIYVERNARVNKLIVVLDEKVAPSPKTSNLLGIRMTPFSNETGDQSAETVCTDAACEIPLSNVDVDHIYLMASIRGQRTTIFKIKLENNEPVLPPNCVSDIGPDLRTCICGPANEDPRDEQCRAAEPLNCMKIATNGNSVSGQTYRTPTIFIKANGDAAINMGSERKVYNLVSPESSADKFTFTHRREFVSFQIRNFSNRQLNRIWMASLPETEAELTAILSRNFEVPDGQVVHFDGAYCQRAKNVADNMVCECDPTSRVDVHFSVVIPNEGRFLGNFTAAIGVDRQTIKFEESSLIKFTRKEHCYKLHADNTEPKTVGELGGQSYKISEIRNTATLSIAIGFMVDGNCEKAETQIANLKFKEHRFAVSRCEPLESQPNRSICGCGAGGDFRTGECQEMPLRPTECAVIQIDEERNGKLGYAKAGIQLDLYEEFDRSVGEKVLYLRMDNTDYALKYKIENESAAKEFQTELYITSDSAATNKFQGTLLTNFEPKGLFKFLAGCEIEDKRIRCVCCQDNDNDEICKKLNGELPAEEPSDPNPQNPDPPNSPEQPNHPPEQPEQPTNDTAKTEPTPKDPQPDANSPKEKKCSDLESTADREICELSKSTQKIDRENIGAVAAKAAKAFDPKNVSSDGIHFVSNLISEMSTVGNLSPQQQTQIFGLIDSVLSVEPDKLSDQGGSTAKLSAAVENIAKTADKLEYLSGKELAIHKNSVTCDGDWMGISDDGENFSVDSDGDGNQASIHLDSRGLCDGNEESKQCSISLAEGMITAVKISVSFAGDSDPNSNAPLLKINIDNGNIKLPTPCEHFDDPEYRFCFCRPNPSAEDYKASCLDTFSAPKSCEDIQPNEQIINGHSRGSATFRVDHRTAEKTASCSSGRKNSLIKTTDNKKYAAVWDCDNNSKLSRIWMSEGEASSETVIRDVTANFEIPAKTIVYFKSARCWNDQAVGAVADFLVCECDPIRYVNLHYSVQLAGRGTVQAQTTLNFFPDGKLTFATKAFNKLMNSELTFELPRGASCSALDKNCNFVVQDSTLIFNIYSKARRAQFDEPSNQIAKLDVPNIDKGRWCQDQSDEKGAACTCHGNRLYNATECPGRKMTVTGCDQFTNQRNVEELNLYRASGFFLNIGDTFEFERAAAEKNIYFAHRERGNIMAFKYRALTSDTEKPQFPIEAHFGTAKANQLHEGENSAQSLIGNYTINFDNDGGLAMVHFKGMCDTTKNPTITCVCCINNNEDDICKQMPTDEPPPPPEDPNSDDETPESPQDPEDKPSDPKQPPSEPKNPEEPQKPPEKKEPDSPTEEKPKKKECEEMEAEKERELCRLEKETPKVTEKNLDAVLEKTTFDPKNLSADGLNVVSSLITNMAAVANMSPKQQTKVFGLIDSALSVDQSKFADKSAQGAAAQQLIKAVESIAEKSEKLTYLGGKELGIHKKPVECGEEGWLGMTDLGSEFTVEDSTQRIASIHLDVDGLCQNDGWFGQWCGEM